MSGTPLDLDDPQQPYRQVAGRLRAAIASGEIAVGERLGSVRQIAREYQVSAGTVQQALRVLREEGLITTWQGRGTFVRADATSNGDPGAVDLVQQVDDLRGRLGRLEDEVAALRHQASPER